MKARPPGLGVGRRASSPRRALPVAVIAIAASIGLGHGVGPAATGGSASAASPRQGGQLAIDELLSIAHPSQPTWSPRGERIALLRERDGAVDLWWTAESTPEPVAVTAEAGEPRPGAVDGFCWTADGAGLIYALAGDLYLYELGSGVPRRLTANPAADSGPTLSPDGRRLAFLRDGAVWVVSFPGMEGGSVGDVDGGFRELRWSPGGAFLAALWGESERLIESTRDLAGSKLEFSRRRRTPADLALIDASSGRLRWLERGDAYAGEATFAATGRLAWQEVSHDAKQRRILAAAPPEWEPEVLVHEVEEAWWTLTYLEAGPRWHPDGERLVFLSERDGWSHLYLLDPAEPGAEPLQLTRGEFEVEEPAWSPLGDRIAVSSNRGSLAERGLFLLDMAGERRSAGATPALVPISRLRGTSTAARWRPDGQRLLFLHADPLNPLDLWVQRPAAATAEQLTDSWPEAVAESELIAPQMVRYASNDGQLIPAQLFLPANHDESDAPLPAVVWVHGGGIRQNRYGWHPLRAYAVFYGFHQYLVQQGYVVLAVDYRGSVGYGKAFRQAQHLDLGGRDLDDVLAAVRYLGRIEDVEVGRIGLWGISYGGYLTLQALVQAPTAFDAGINVAGVADWADWAVDPGGLWIEGRMGPVAENPELYRQRSPIHFVERLARPLLSLHGTADSSVPVLQSFRLVDALVAAGRPFEVMFYPGEQHVFTRDRSWRDAFRRVEEFFDRHLR